MLVRKRQCYLFISLLLSQNKGTTTAAGQSLEQTHKNGSIYFSPVCGCEKYWGFTFCCCPPGSCIPWETWARNCPRTPNFWSASAEFFSFMTLGQVLLWKQNFSWAAANREQELGVAPGFHQQSSLSDPGSGSRSVVLVLISTFSYLFYTFFPTRPSIRAPPSFALRESPIPGTCGWIFSSHAKTTPVSALSHAGSNPKALPWAPCWGAPDPSAEMRLQPGSGSAKRGKCSLEGKAGRNWDWHRCEQPRMEPGTRDPAQRKGLPAGVYLQPPAAHWAPPA